MQVALENDLSSLKECHHICGGNIFASWIDQMQDCICVTSLVP